MASPLPAPSDHVSTGAPDPAITPELREAALDFQIEKTYVIANELTLSAGRAYLTYYVLIVITLCLAFGKSIGVEDKITVPFFELTLNKHFAAFATLILSSLAIYHASSLAAAESFTQIKLSDLLKERYLGLCPNLWHLTHPTPFIVLWNLFASAWFFRTIIALVGYGAYLFVVAFPFVMTWKLSRDAGFSTTWTVLLTICSLILSLPALLARGNPFRDDRKYVRKLDAARWY